MKENKVQSEYSLGDRPKCSSSIKLTIYKERKDCLNSFSKIYVKASSAHSIDVPVFVYQDILNSVIPEMNSFEKKKCLLFPYLLLCS